MFRVAIAPRIPLSVSDDGQCTSWNMAPFLRSHSKNSCSSVLVELDPSAADVSIASLKCTALDLASNVQPEAIFLIFVDS